MTPEACQRLYAEASKSVDPAKHIETALANMESIRAKRFQIERDKLAAINMHAKEMQQLNARCQEIQGDCSHWNTRYHVGPSSCDSYTECLDCGGTVE